MQSPLLHTPRADPKAIAIEEKDLHAVPSFVGKEKQMTALRILLELPNDKSIEAIEAEPHVRRAGGHENARGRAQTEHRYTSPSATIKRRSVTASNPAHTPIRRPPDSSTYKAVCDASCATGRSTTSTGISDTAGAGHLV